MLKEIILAIGTKEKVSNAPNGRNVFLFQDVSFPILPLSPRL